MNNPTKISAGAVAAPGIIPNNGDNTSANKNNTPVVNAVNPVLPPSATPDADSTYVVTVEVPKQAPTVVPMASAKRACLTFGSFPFSSSIFAFEDTPIKVPSVSKMSTNRNENMTINISNEKTFENSNLKATSANDGGAENIPRN